MLDFGIAKTGSVALTRQGQILGTPSYLAPERLREKEVAIDGRADIFSLGVLLFTMLTGEAPFVGEDVYEVIDKIAKESHPELALNTTSGRAIARVVDKMLAKRPEDRYRSAGESAAALREVLRLLDSRWVTEPQEMAEDAPEQERTAISAMVSEPEAPKDKARAVTAPSGENLVAPSAPSGQRIPDSAATMPRAPGLNAGLNTVQEGNDVVQPSPMETEVMGSAQDDDEPPAEPTAVGPSPSHMVHPVTVSEVDAQGGPTAVAAAPQQFEDELTREDSGIQGKLDLPAVRAAEPNSPIPVKATDILGTRPELALQRETRQLKTRPPEAVQPDIGSLPNVDTTPSLPSFDDREETYQNHSALNDETTDDETVADPEFREREAEQLKAIMRAHEQERETEQVLRASDPDHAELKTENDPSRGSPPHPGLGSAAHPATRPKTRPSHASRRSRIEASLVDEDEVVVKPAPLESMNPEELPTQTGFSMPGQNQGAEVLDDDSHPSMPDVVRARGDSQVQDPAEIVRAEISILPTPEVEPEPPKAPEPARSDPPRSAAVARRTFGPSGGSNRAPSGKAKVQVRISGDVLSANPSDGMRLIRRRVLLLVIGALASVAIGLLLGRMRKSPSKTPPERIEVPRPSAQPRVKQHGGLAPEKRTRSAKELLTEAEEARNQQQLPQASALYERAVKAAKAGGALHARALLGHAEVLILLDDKRSAIGRYRMVRRYHPKTEHARQAKVALQDLGASVRSSPRKARPEKRVEERKSPPRRSAVRKPEESRPAPPPVEAAASTSLELEGKSPAKKCLLVKRKYFGEPEKAVRAFKALRAEHPSEPCVYWQLGQLYQNRLKKNRAALDYYRRFLKLAPNSPKRHSVQRRIADIEAKLQL